MESSSFFILNQEVSWKFCQLSISRTLKGLEKMFEIPKYQTTALKQTNKQTNKKETWYNYHIFNYIFTSWWNSLFFNQVDLYSWECRTFQPSIYLIFPFLGLLNLCIFFKKSFVGKFSFRMHHRFQERDLEREPLLNILAIKKWNQKPKKSIWESLLILSCKIVTIVL